MKLINFCLRITNKINRFLIPQSKYSQDLYEEVLFENIREGFSWLDIGCGHKVLSDWRLAQEKELVKRCDRVVGVDPDGEAIKKHKTIKEVYKSDSNQLEFSDNTFDVVTANMVMEHLDQPLVMLKEVHRVLKPGGIFIFHTPNLRGHIAFLSNFIPSFITKKLVYFLTGRREDDVYPTFYKANTLKQIEELAETSNFEHVKTYMNQGHPLAMGILFPPIYFLELLWVKLILSEKFKNYRGNIVCILRGR